LNIANDATQAAKKNNDVRVNDLQARMGSSIQKRLKST
jgi:hypothetical protein